MTLVRGTLLGVVTCLALTGAPAQAAAAAAAPSAAPQAARSAAEAGKDWQVLKSWKGGVMRGCRGEWDGDSFLVTFQLANRAEAGRRGGVLAVRSDEFPEWQTLRVEPIAAGTKQTFFSADVAERPRAIDVRAKVTKGQKRSAWGQVVRLDRLSIC